MRIAFISLMGDAPWGGSEVLWSKTAALALVTGHQVLITAYEWPELAPPLLALQEQGAELFLREQYNHQLSRRLLGRVVAAARPGVKEVKRLKEFAPDLVVVNQGGYGDIIHKPELLAWLLQGSVPYYLLCHLYQDPMRLSERDRTVILQVYRAAREVLTISENQTEVLRRQLLSKQVAFRVVQNPVNIPAQVPVPFPQPAIPQLAIVASLDTDRKGHDVLLAALSMQLWRARAWHLNIYGQGPDLDYLTQLVAYYQLTERVTFHGHVADSAQIWQLNQVLIIASRIESGPMVLIEAMLCGRPVVSTSVGLVEEWLEEGQTGFIAEGSIATSLGKALDRCWQAQAQWAQLGQQAYEHASRHVESNPVATLLSLLVS